MGYRRNVTEYPILLHEIIFPFTHLRHYNAWQSLAQGPVRPFSQPETLSFVIADWVIAPWRLLWYFAARLKSLFKIPIRAQRNAGSEGKELRVNSQQAANGHDASPSAHGPIHAVSFGSQQSKCAQKKAYVGRSSSSRSYFGPHR